jgi:hypothetical protein
VVSSRDLRDHNERATDFRSGDLRHLRDERLIEGVRVPAIAITGLSSTAIADALNSENGRVECVVLSHVYRHLSPLVTSDRETPLRVEKGAARGDTRSARPQPRVSTPCTISSTSALL